LKVLLQLHLFQDKSHREIGCRDRTWQELDWEISWMEKQTSCEIAA